MPDISLFSLRYEKFLSFITLYAKVCNLIELAVWTRMQKLWECIGFGSIEASRDDSRRACNQ